MLNKYLSNECMYDSDVDVYSVTATLYWCDFTQGTHLSEFHFLIFKMLVVFFKIRDKVYRASSIVPDS